MLSGGFYLEPGMAGKSKEGGVFRDNAIGIATAVTCAVILSVGSFIANGVKDNGYEIRRLKERHDALEQSVSGIKEAVFKLGLSKDPKSAEILGGLVMDAPTARGVELYRNGQVAEAVAAWKVAHANGSRDAEIALMAAGVAVPTDRTPPAKKNGAHYTMYGLPNDQPVPAKSDPPKK
jgi:hypothetical protein